MSDGLQNALAETLRMTDRLMTLLEFGVIRQERCRGRSRSRSRRCCPRCSACKERSRPPSPRRELRAKLLPRCRGLQGAAQGDDAKSHIAATQTEDEYMRYVDQSLQDMLDAAQRDCQMRRDF